MWEVRLEGVAPGEAAAAVEAFLAAERAEVSRMTKNGVRTFDARAAVVSIGVAEAASRVAGGPCAILRVVVRHVTPAVRPDDVLAGLSAIGALAPPSAPLVVRLAQGPLDDETGTVSDPLAPDRDASTTTAFSAVLPTALDEGDSLRAAPRTVPGSATTRPSARTWCPEA